MTPLRETLSTIAEANGVTTAISSRRTVPQIPTAVMPPASYAHTTIAVAYAQSPIAEPAKARFSRRRAGLRKTVPSEVPVSRTASPIRPISGRPR